MDFKEKDKIEVVLKQEGEAEESTISLREIIQAIINGKWIILGVTIGALILTLIGLYFTNPYSSLAKTMVSFSFEGIEKGLDPYGKKFDVGNIKSVNVLSKVVEKLNLKEKGVSTEILRRNIDIEPVVPGNITEKIKQLQEAKKENIEEQEGYVYYPNQFIISFGAPKGIGISGKDTRNILNEVMRQYEEYFYNTYTDREVLGNAIGNINYDEYDYPEVSTVMHNQISIMQSYLSSKLSEKNGGTFRSKRTAMTFNDIVDSVQIVRSVDLGRLDSIIGAFNLTKDKEKLIKLYEYRIKRLDLEKSKKGDESRIVQDMLGKYQKEKNMILMPGLNGDAGLGSIEFERKDDYYDALSERYTNTGVESTDASHDISYYQREIEKFRNDTVSEDLKKVAVKEVVELINNIKLKLERWINITNDTVMEYYETERFNQAVNKLSPAENYPVNEKSNMIIAVAILAGLMIGAFVAFFMDYWKRSGMELVVDKIGRIKDQITIAQNEEDKAEHEQNDKE